jgi:hypothetical protein
MKTCFKRFFWLLLVGAACLASATPLPEPLLGEEQVHAKAAPVGKVLLVFDVRAEGPPKSVFQNSRDAAQRIYAPLSEAMSAAVVQTGGLPTIVYAYNADDLPQDPRDYDQVWTQRLVAFTSRHIRKGGEETGYRKWLTTIHHRATAGAQLELAYQASFGSDCQLLFSLQDRDCKLLLRQFIAGQWSNYLEGTTTAKFRASLPPAEEATACLPPSAAPGALVRIAQLGVVRVKQLAAVNAHCGGPGSPGGSAAITGIVEIRPLNQWR